MSRTGAKLPPLPNSASYIAPTPVPEDATHFLLISCARLPMAGVECSDRV